MSGCGKYKKLKEKHDSKVTEVQRLEKDIVNLVFKNYINPEDREKLLREARTFCFSEVKIADVQQVFDNYNTDTMVYNAAVDIMEMEDFIQETKKEGFFSRIANVITHGESDNEEESD